VKWKFCCRRAGLCLRHVVCRCDEQHVLSLTEGVRGYPERSGKASERAGAGEYRFEEAGGRGGTGQGHPARGSLGKLLSPANRRQAVDHVRESPGRSRASERRACRLLGQSRPTQRRQHRVCEDELRLVREMVELAEQYGRYGYRRVTELLCRRGWKVNHKRIERLWRREGLIVPQKQPKRRRLWFNDGFYVQLRPAGV